MTENEPIDPRELRVSDAERSHVVSVLQKAIGHGMLSLDEFTARTDIALAAKTRGELNAVLVDLPGVTHQDPNAPVREKPVELRANMSTLKRVGRWTVPRELIVRNRLGSTELDFSEAEIEHAEVRIVLDVSGGSVKLLLPERASAVTDEVTVNAGAVKDKVGSGGGRPRFVLAGTVTMGSLHLRRASYVRIGSLLFRSPWKISRAAD
ncbi:DUF1707 domain-containing protein [Actinophytocola sp.]|uniref:DUF1707 SHOCT-like domain-containing protein n=1 Tax=Actinophytocola sp. TaxID=1872138 RepID=UPI0025B86135|nr:DUF1707 domain-containing protein [Actinophytocola sp.]